MSLVFNNSGNVLSMMIEGYINVKCFLSQEKPRVRISLNDQLVIGTSKTAYGNVLHFDTCTFHSSVNQKQFVTDHALDFLPPDGEFTVMKYQITSEFKLPFRIFTQIEKISEKRVDLIIKVRADIPPENYGHHVVVVFPLLNSIKQISYDTEGNKNVIQRVENIDNSIQWTIDNFPGGTEQILHIKVFENTTQFLKKLPPISMKFEIPMWIASQMQIKHIKVVDPLKSYHPYRWVRFSTKSNSYIARFHNF